MTDESDGGGRMSGVEIATGNTNGVFDDISDVDRAAGDCSIRKIYATVTSDSADKYLDAGVVVMKPPADPNASVLMFSTGSFYDEHDDLRSKVESSIVRGAMYSGYLWGDHSTGQRAITIWQRVTGELPGAGRRMELVAFDETRKQTNSQTIWLTKITEAVTTRTEGEIEFLVRRVTCELAEALRGEFIGTEPSLFDPGPITLKTRIYETRYNAGAFPVYGVQLLTGVAATGEYSIEVDSLYAPLIPTAFTETAIPDATPGGDSLAIVQSASTAVSYTTTADVVGPNKSLFAGSGVLPGSFSLVVSGASITDLGGVLFAAGVERGTINYSTGACQFNSGCPSYGTTSKTISFTPAAAPLRVEDTASQVVTVENRGFVWVITLLPVPAPNTLRISYRVNNSWYQINDTGNGQLSGADSSYGSATLDFTTGTVVLQTGELPDVDSEIIYAWGTAVNYITMPSGSLSPAIVKGQCANAGIIKGSVVVTWGTNELKDNDPDNLGKLQGTGGHGLIDYIQGKWYVIPDVIPEMGTEFDITYEYGDAKYIQQTITGSLPDTNGNVNFVLTTTPIQEGSIVIEAPVKSQELSSEYFESFSNGTTPPAETNEE
ncbi:hypothetical protein HUU62_08615 [Rhodoferax sp. 4810]|nr:hypothetical protein [Rhodoferax jenense]